MSEAVDYAKGAQPAGPTPEQVNIRAYIAATSTPRMGISAPGQGRGARLASKLTGQGQRAITLRRLEQLLARAMHPSPRKD